MQWPHAAVAFSFAKPRKMSPPRDFSTAPASRKQDAPNARAGAFSVSKFKGGNFNGGGCRPGGNESRHDQRIARKPELPIRRSLTHAPQRGKDSIRSLPFSHAPTALPMRARDPG